MSLPWPTPVHPAPNRECSAGHDRVAWWAQRDECCWFCGGAGQRIDKPVAFSNPSHGAPTFGPATP